MKKILLLAVSAMIASAAQANTSAIQIVDANGNDVSNTTINVTIAEESEDLWGGVVYAMHSNLSVKNVSDNLVHCQVPYDIQEMSHGYHSICYGNCVENTTTGQFDGEIQIVKSGATFPLRAEYFPLPTAKEGKCVVTYKTEIYTAELAADGVSIEYTFQGEGPSVTVNYLFGDAGVEDLVANKTEVSATYYDLSGREVSNPANGLYIKRTAYNDGSVNNAKVFVK